MQQNKRTFEDSPARREKVPLLIGLMGPSGGGKTFSALRLATGIQRVTGGEIFVIDTEANRAKHYAPKPGESVVPGKTFAFRHVPFGAPFSPLDYLAAIEHCCKRGAGVIVVDSMSHEHEGPGGVLEMHESEVERMGGAKHNFRAWAEPKSQRRRLINSILQMTPNFIFCFRAKNKSKPSKEKGQREELVELGMMPIAGEEFVYEMTACALLPPGANGVPLWNPQLPGERQMVKLPAQFQSLFSNSTQLSEDIGENLAKWAAGEDASPVFRIPRGEHEGKTLAEAPEDYLRELLKKSKGKPLAELIEAELEYRAEKADAEAEEDAFNLETPPDDLEQKLRESVEGAR